MSHSCDCSDLAAIVLFWCNQPHCPADALTHQARCGGTPETPLHHLGAAVLHHVGHPPQLMQAPSCLHGLALSKQDLVSCCHMLRLFIAHLVFDSIHS